MASVDTIDEAPQIVVLPWITYLEERLADKTLEAEEKHIIGLLQTMLLAAEVLENDVDPVADAIQGIGAYYTTQYNEPYTLWKLQPDNGVELMIDMISTYAFELSINIPFENIRHKRLADMLIHLKTTAPLFFNPEVTWTKIIGGTTTIRDERNKYWYIPWRSQISYGTIKGLKLSRTSAGIATHVSFPIHSDTSNTTPH